MTPGRRARLPGQFLGRVAILFGENFAAALLAQPAAGGGDAIALIVRPKVNATSPPLPLSTLHRID